MIKIPVFDPKPEYLFLKDEIDAAIQEVLLSGRFIMGPQVHQFEENVAEYLGVKHAVALNSGTDAILIGLRALGIELGDEVITTAFSFFATAEAISILGATPVFVDIDPKTYNIDTSKIENSITEKTKAIIPVHLYGQASDMDAIMTLAKQYNLLVLEDVAQSFGGEWKGKKLGTIGDIGAFSFFPTKNLGAYGDSGLLTTDNDDLAEMARMLRVHGSMVKYQNEVVGYNSRMDAIQAAILNVKLKYIDSSNEKRRKVAERYFELLDEVDQIVLPRTHSDAYHVYHQFTLRIKNDTRDFVKAKLREQGIGSMIYYPIPIHKLPVYKDFELNLPEAELASKEVLSLPMWPLLSEKPHSFIVCEVAQAIKSLKFGRTDLKK